MRLSTYSFERAAELAGVTPRVVREAYESGDLERFAIGATKRRPVGVTPLRMWMDRHGYETRAWLAESSRIIEDVLAETEPTKDEV